jgi:hypothetical protein
MYQDLHFYIDLDWTKQIEEPTYLKHISSLTNLAYLHRANVYYSEHQLDDFTQHCNDLDENYLESIGEKLDIILKNAKKIKEQNYIFEVCFSNEQTDLIHVPNMVISSLQSFSNQALLSSQFSSKTFLVIKSNTEFEKITISYFSDLANITKWIVANSAKRNFHISPKHGENGKGNWKGESVLLCSKTEAETLLNSAIPDFNEKENRLFNWDSTNKGFIEFFFEGENPQKQWHGFHVAETDLSRVPNSIRKYFSK